MRARTRIARTALAALMALSLWGGTTATGGVAAAATTQRVKIVDFRYKPRTINIARGTRVRWKNLGDAPHTVTAKNGKWDSGLLRTGETYRRRFRRAGTFRYFCTIHPNMTAKVVVA